MDCINQRGTPDEGLLELGTLLFDGDERLVGVMGLEIADGQVLRSARSSIPEKLVHIGPTADLGQLLRRET
jgi:hypothetical protein